MNKRTIKIISLALIPVAVGVFMFASGHMAIGLWDEIGEFVGSIIGIFINLLGALLSLIIGVLIWIAQYNDFIYSPVVMKGWVVVRDICNMFFVVILLIIAFGTILNLKEYSYKTLLPRLLLMAVLINFSKTISGLFIDVAQVIMLTFVNAFKDVGAGSLIDMLGLTSVVTMANNSEDIGFWAIVGAYFIGLIYMLVSVVVVGTMLMVLVMRMVMIWVYVVLSPLAYLLATFPGGKHYSSQWWSGFTKNLVVGPVLAFFIWLSFSSSMSFDNSSTQAISLQQGANDAGFQTSENNNTTTSIDSLPDGASKASTGPVFIKFIVSIGLLIAGLKLSQEIGGEAGSLAGKGMNLINEGKSKMISGARKGVKGVASYGADKLHQKTGVDLNLSRVWKGVKEQRAENKENRYLEGQLVARKAGKDGNIFQRIASITGDPKNAWQQLSTARGWRERIRGGKNLKKRKERAKQEIPKLEEDLELAKDRTKFVNSDSEAEKENIKNRAEKIKDERGKYFDNKIKEIDDHEDLTEDEKKEKIKNKEIEIKNIQNNQSLSYGDKEEQVLEKKNEIIKIKNHKNLTKKEKIQKRKEIEEKRKEMEKNTTGWYDEYKDANKEEKEKMVLSNESNIRGMLKSLKKNKQRISPSTLYTNTKDIEQKLVSKETDRIKDISNTDKLIEILRSAMNSHNNALVSASLLKLFKGGDDKAVLTDFTGRSDYIGLQKLVRDISDKNSDNYAGFSRQNAFSLGDQLSELNKANNHYAASSAYVVEGDEFREANKEEHLKSRNASVEKVSLIKQAREFNSLAYGSYDKKGNFHIDVGGVIQLMKFNNESGHKMIGEMNSDTAENLYKVITGNDKITKYFEKHKTDDGDTIMDALEKRLNETSKQNGHKGTNKDAEDLLRENT